MASIKFDHLGVVVSDLEGTAEFFAMLGFEREGTEHVSGGWVDRLMGMEGVRAEKITMTAPEGGSRLELTKFHQPAEAAVPAQPSIDSHGYRHVACTTPDIAPLLEKAKDAGFESVAEDVRYLDTEHRLVYIRGPEGLIVEFSEQV